MEMSQFREIVERARDVIIVTEAAPLDEPGPRIVYVNPAFTRLTGYTAEEAIGRSPRFLQHPPQVDPDTLYQIRHGLETESGFHGPILNYSKDGRGYWLDMHIFPLRDAEGTVTHFAAIERDVTARTLREMELHSAAHTDPLTGLFNRRALIQMITAMWKPDTLNSVMMIDVDNFKGVNDRHGHAVGDAVLQRLGDVLVKTVRDGDYPVRMGGDEFLLVLMDTNARQATGVAQRVQEELEYALASSGLPATTVSIGIGTDHQPLETLVDVADRALRQAKAAGRDRILSG